MRNTRLSLTNDDEGFCFTRICATSLRIAWSQHPDNVALAMAAQIFVYAGIVLLFIANLFFTQRIVRAQHPHFGWTKPFSVALPILFVIIIGTILMLIAAVIVQFYSLSTNAARITRDLQIYGETLYAVVSFLPIPVVIISSLARMHPKIRNTKTIDKFGHGSMRAKIAIVLVSAVFLCLGASFRAGTDWLPPVDLRTTTGQLAPSPWYFSKGAFFAFDFSIEICIVLSWLVLRIDKRFIIPNGAKGPYSYGGGFTFAGEPGNEKPQLGNRDSMRHLTGSQVSGVNSSRISWGGSRNSMARESRISWGGVSREDVAAGLGEDGSQLPYPGFEEETVGNTAADVGVAGAEKEMGWDAKSGKWALRPVSGALSQIRPTSIRDDL